MRRMYEFEIRERQDENQAARNYHRNYHDFPIMKYWDEDFYSFVASHFKVGDRVLDLGCGPGSLWNHWSRLPAPGALVGVDLSDEMIAEARKAHPNGCFAVGRAHDLPFPSGSFDLVIASAVLHHIPDDHLDGALREIVRVMDEHGTLIGREPVGQGQLGSKTGWLSGALMSFRHLVSRLTHTREYPEPELGEHHHAYDVNGFLDTVSHHLLVTNLHSRFPVSNYIARSASPALVRVAKLLDETAGHRLGSMFHYKACRNHATAADVARCVSLELQDRGDSPEDKEFLACLQVAAAKLEELLSHDERSPR